MSVCACMRVYTYACVYEYIDLCMCEYIYQQGKLTTWISFALAHHPLPIDHLSRQIF